MLQVCNMFSRCESLVSVDLSNFNTEKVENMGCMFENCKSMKYVNLSSFNTEKVTTMHFMFKFCSSLESLIYQPLIQQM